MRELGPGYDVGYFAWDGLVARPDGCSVDQSEIERLQTVRDELLQGSNSHSSLGEFFNELRNSAYHENGHLAVGQCQGGSSPMVYSQVSARDPIFWRWHRHISDFVRAATENIYPGYY